MYEARIVKVEQGSILTCQPTFPRKHCTLPMTPEMNYCIFLLISGISEIPNTKIFWKGEPGQNPGPQFKAPSAL